jgi:hypothetical protein
MTKARQRAERELRDVEQKLGRRGRLHRPHSKDRRLDDLAYCLEAIHIADDGLTKLAEQERDLRAPPVALRASQRPAAADLAPDLPGHRHELDDQAIEL